MSNSLSRRMNRSLNRNQNMPASIFSVQPFGTLRDELDQLLSNWFSSSESGTQMPAFSPSLDMHETDSGYEVKVDLPGVKPSEVNVHVADNMLTISGERRFEKHEGKKGEESTPHLVERYHGTFSRSIMLPAAVKQDKIEAEFRDGVLRISLPKAEETKPFKVAVK